MKYYRITSDERIISPLTLSNYKFTHNKSFEDLVVFEEFKNSTKLIDYIEKCYLFDRRYIVSDMVKQTIMAYNPTLDFNAVFVTNKAYSFQYAYWEIRPDTVDCIVKKAKDNKFTLRKDEIEASTLFVSLFEKNSFLFCRFDVAESIMRRLPLGICFVPVDLI